MAWLIDPRRWDDSWWAGLSPYAARIWECCLTGQFRTVLPGLCKGVSVSTLYDVCALRVRRPERRCTVGQFEEDLLELQEPDEHGKVHFYFDPTARVARVPMAPAYNHADNPNVLTAWYRAWRDIPDCDHKFEHIASLRLGVNFTYTDRHGRHSMAEKWGATFGQPERAFLDGGRRLKTYVDLKERWVTNQAGPPTVPYTLPYTHPDTPQQTLPGVLPSGSGSRIKDQGSGSGIKTVPGTVPYTPDFFVSPQNQIEPIASSIGGVDNGAGGSGSEPHGVTGGARGGAGGAPGGGGNGWGSSGVGSGEVPAPGPRMPPGVE